MKFTDGYWQMRPDVTARFPVHVHDVEVAPDSLTVYGATKRLAHRGDTLNLPLLVWPNSIIAVGSHEDRPDYDYDDGVTLQAYELAEGQPITVGIPSIAGSVELIVVLRREGQTITVKRQGSARRWQLLLVGVESIGSIEGGVATGSARGVRVTPAQNADSLSISLSAPA